MAKNRIVYLAAVVSACLFYSFYFRWFSWYLLLLMLAMPLFSLLCSLPAMLSLRVTTDAPAAVQRNGKAELLFTAKALLPVAACRAAVVCKTPFGGEEKKTLYLPLGKSAVPLPAQHCGVLTYTIEPVRVYDYLGLFCLKVRAEQKGEVLVCPVAAAPETMPKPVITQPVRYQKSSVGSNEAYELREYVPGDDLRTVHWKATAKQDELIVREPMAEEQAPVVLTFDPGADADTADWVLERVLWVSRWLLSQDKAHEIYWQEAAGGARRSALIREEEDILPAMERIVRSLPSVYSAAEKMLKASWHCHIAKKEVRP